jgi:hypothetical protein
MHTWIFFGHLGMMYDLTGLCSRPRIGLGDRDETAHLTGPCVFCLAAPIVGDKGGDGPGLLQPKVAAG